MMTDFAAVNLIEEREDFAAADLLEGQANHSSKKCDG